MNKVKVEKNSDGTVTVTFPAGGQSVSVSPKEAAKRLKSTAEEYQQAIDDMKAKREELERMSP